MSVQLDIFGAATWDGTGIMPLECFRPEHRELIEREAAQDRPPPKWRTTIDGLAQIPSRGWAEWHRLRGRDPHKVRSALAPALKALVIERDGYVCGLCGGDVDPEDVHIDHILPWSLGGGDELSNLQVAHSFCNVSKGNRV